MDHSNSSNLDVYNLLKLDKQSRGEYCNRNTSNPKYFPLVTTIYQYSAYKAATLTGPHILSPQSNITMCRVGIRDTCDTISIPTLLSEAAKFYDYRCSEAGLQGKWMTAKVMITYFHRRGISFAVEYFSNYYPPLNIELFIMLGIHSHTYFLFSLV